jgi:DNA-binding beta-propeller fold protein YncE
LPNNWVQRNAIGVALDSKDNVRIIHRTTRVPDNFKLGGASCCVVAPAILGFDQEGNLIGHWGGPGPGYEWPESNHGLTIDYKGNFWIGGNAQKDTQVLKFTAAGKFLLQIGKHGVSAGSNDTQNLSRATEVTVDQSANEVYDADGYGNRRVIVFDADTGAHKRHWGAYGNKPDDTNLGNYNPDVPPVKQFRTPVHCAEISNDGLVYVCDRTNDRIQVFHKDGTFVKETFIARKTLGAGSVWDIAFSGDPQQKYIGGLDAND